ncbi:acyl carrier protein [Cupriavidus necator]|uniref:acyl carrier protein n=1 Tax=Cupriavidus necator TaxID=106590 RepID=UPI0039C472FF
MRNRTEHKAAPAYDDAVHTRGGAAQADPAFAWRTAAVPCVSLPEADNMSIIDKLHRVFADVLCIQEERVTDDLTYNTIPEWDSVAHMALVAEIENLFEIMMDTDDIVDMSSVAKAKEILAKYRVVM